MGENAKGSAATVSGTPRSLISLKSIKKPCESRTLQKETGHQSRYALYQNWCPVMVAGVGFEPHDLRVMSPTSYQAALPRDILTAKKGIGAGDRSRTGTMLSHHGILSPGRLPIPPHRQKHLRARSNTAATGFFLTTPLL